MYVCVCLWCEILSEGGCFKTLALSKRIHHSSLYSWLNSSYSMLPFVLTEQKYFFRLCQPAHGYEGAVWTDVAKRCYRWNNSTLQELCGYIMCMCVSPVSMPSLSDIESTRVTTAQIMCVCAYDQWSTSFSWRTFSNWLTNQLRVLQTKLYIIWILFYIYSLKKYIYYIFDRFGRL